MTQIFPQPICQSVWESKYQFKTNRVEYSPDVDVTDTWNRIANACAQSGRYPFGEQGDPYRRFYSILEDFKFSPAGRIVAGAGTGRNVTLFNCFVMGTIPDSLEGIFEMLKEAALTMQQGGGIGYDFSTIRPDTAFVKGVEAEASGPLSFMDVWNRMCHTIMSAGGRRGAMMATMMCNHPNIKDFITAKREKGRLNQFNMSVLVTDELLNKVKTGEDIALVHEEPPMIDSGLGQDEGGKYIYEYVNAKELWELIMAETYHHAEPGVIFIDRINQENNLWFAETIMATNPCGEQPLPPYGACLLGSLNLTKFVKNPFTDEAEFDYDEMQRVTGIAVELTDCVIDISNFPLEAQREEAMHKRRMGLGVTGLADAMFMLGMKYGDQESQEFTRAVLRKMTHAAYSASVDLAKQYGCAPVLDDLVKRQLMTVHGHARKLNQGLKDAIVTHGIRNSHLISIAPTGTMSLYMGNISSGVEPNFADRYGRKVLQKDGSKVEEMVYAASILVFDKLCGMAKAKQDYAELERLEQWKHAYWCTAQDLTPEDHVAIQAAAQEWVDSSISKTVNLPEDISMEDFANVYIDAYERGCKGCTTYRPNDVLGSVLSVESDKPKDETPEVEADEDIPVAVNGPVLADRPYELDGKTFKLRWQGNAYYVNFTHAPGPEGWWVPQEVFITTKNPTHQAWVAALTRMVSAVFRRGGDIRFVVEELKQIHDPQGGEWIDGKYCPSLVALLGKTLDNYLMAIGYQSTPEDGSKPTVQPATTLENKVNTSTEDDGDSTPQIVTAGTPNQCPSCNEYALVVQSGCPTCQECGWSKCS